ncbi:MAG TPA: hypothetical protein ENI38_01210 [Candidatus Acetothermia bacterium]|nr:hypothetical protein [Candidatus Acetothermia bacterium]
MTAGSGQNGAGNLRYEVQDLFPAFCAAWKELTTEDPQAQLDVWARSLGSCPGLLEKQISCYSDEGLDWREVVREHVLPFLSQRLPAMREARAALHRVIGPVCLRAQQQLGLDFSVLFVIYVGMGCGAGWATQLRGRPACLLGLENIAEREWQEEDSLRGLLAHELGHLLHDQWRRRVGRVGIEGCQDPWWQLYVEGFAQRCEHLIVGQESWHQARGQPGWLQWCRENLAQLAGQFLQRASEGEVREFFGSWYEIEGWRQTGYFLGHELIRAWETKLPLREIGVLPGEEVRERVQATMGRWARGTKSGGP